MKRIILLTFLTFSYFLGQSQGIQRWFEDFESEANGAVAGTAAGTPGGTWSVTTTPSGGAASFSRQAYFYNRFTINNTGSEGVWASNVIDISSSGQAAIDISLVTHYASSTDYVRAYYKLDGGAEVLFGEVLGSGYSVGSTASVVLTGTSLQIIVRGMDNTTGNNADGYPNMMRFDDVEVTQVSTLYSRNGGGNWGTSGTWSTVGLNGVSCSCTPDNTTNVVVGNSDVVSITAASDAINITVQNSSTLRWTTNNVALNVSRGGSVTISNTAQINHNGNTGASLVFPVAAAVGLTVNSSTANALLIGDLSVTGAPTLTISGSGSIATADDFLVSGAATIVNNLVGTLAIGDALTINPTAAASFTNAGPMTMGGITTINTPSTFTNNNAVTMSSSGAGVLAGTGTWTQGANASSALNYAGSTITVTTFNASNTGNTVTYNRPGNATLRDPSASTYYNLTIAGSNTKSSSANHIVNNNLLISGAANVILDPLTFNLTVNGTSTVTTGSFIDSNDTGTNTLVGNVSVANGATFNSTAITTTANLIFRGGIANAGTFTAGGATFNTNNQAITGTSAMSFANNVAINGFTVTNSNSGTFTITGTTTLTGGGYTDSNNASVATFVGLVSQSGASAFTTTTVSTETNLIFRGGITNNGGTFTAGGATFNTNAQSIAGTSAISFANFVVVTGIAVSNDNTSSVSLTSNGLSLSGTGTWTQGTNSTLNFAGSSATVTTFNTSNSGNTVNYNSTGTSQAIRVPSTASTYTNLRFNNTFATSPQLTLAGASAITVSGVLTMSSGVASISSNVTLSSNATGALVHNLLSTAGWMYGTGSIVRAIPASAITIATADGFFPLGSAADFRPFFISKTAAGSGNITVSHTSANTTSPVTIADTGPAATIRLRDDAFWTVASTLAAGTLSVRYGGTGLGTVISLSHLRSCLAASVIAGSAHVVASTVSLTDPRVERSTIAFGSLANNYYLGSTAYVSPLPIKLLYFNADIDHDEVALNWATAQETNNDFFTIEKSSNPEQGFQQVSKFPSQGNSTLEQKYAAVDRAPYTGLSYYRLKQTDFDGTSTYSKLVAVNYEGPTFASLRVYPNPLKDQKTVKVEITGLKGISEIPLVIYNFLGQKILEKIIAVGSGGVIQEEFFFEKPLATGVFVIKAGPTLQLTQRLVVE